MMDSAPETDGEISLGETDESEDVSSCRCLLYLLKLGSPGWPVSGL